MRYIHIYIYIYIDIPTCVSARQWRASTGPCFPGEGATLRGAQGPPEYGRSCDYSEQVTIIAHDSLL